MPCTITDYYRYRDATGTPVALVGYTVLAVPASNLYRISTSGTYRPIVANPNITTVAYQYGQTTTTEGNGQFSFALPYAATETKPTSPSAQWSIVLADGRILTGVVPSVAGPITLDDLESTYSWAWTTGVAYTAPTSGVEARGTASFTAADSASVVFGPAMSSSAYQILLTPSVDTGTGTIPSASWTNKSTSGFDIKVSGIFTGSVDWSAKL